MDQLEHLRIQDLIDVPEVQTVIELSETRDLDPDDPHGRRALEQLAHTFIITEDIREILLILLESLTRKNGKGFFIIGNYGSGKSHLLSVLALLARHSWAWNTMAGRPQEEINRYASALTSRKLMPVLIPLTEFNRDLSLEEIIWGSTEVSAALAGVPLTLSHSQRFLSLFEKYILPVHNKEFQNFLKRRIGDEYTWDRIRREDPGSAHTLIHQFLSSRGETIPFSVNPNRKSVVRELTEAIKQSGWDGLVLILDELSEFLKSKSDHQALNEDARFLQFLGESATHFPIWVFAALQEGIERTGDIHESVYKKIKDRYHRPLRLTTRHLKELVSRRLIERKSEEAIHRIREIFDRVQQSFNRIAMSRDEFTQIYPIHPETLELLDKNSDLFSQRRGIVDFLTTQIRGKPESRITGIMHLPADHLLTPDVIFDHFKDRLAESPVFSRYYRLYENHFLSRLPHVFTEESDRVCAEKIIKILTLLAVSPILETRTVRELANMVLYRVMDPSLPAGSLNYDYFHENILKVIYQQIGHLQVQPGDTPLENIYSLDLKTDLAETVEHEIKRIIGDLSPFSPEVSAAVTSVMSHGVFPLAVLFNRIVHREGINWQHTRRTITVRFGHFSRLTHDEIQSARQRLLNGESHFILFIGWFGNINRQLAYAQKFLAGESPALANAWGFYMPLTHEPHHYRSFLEIYACEQMISQLADDASESSGQKIRLLKSRLDANIDDAREQIQTAFQQGFVYTLTGGNPRHAKPPWNISISGWARS